MEEEIKIQEAETEQVKSEDDKKEEAVLPAETVAEDEKKRRTDIYIEFALIFILGILIGVAVKTEAAKRITIGFDDYKMKISSQDYDINKMQAELVKKNIEASQETQDPAEVENQDAPQEENAN